MISVDPHGNLVTDIDATKLDGCPRDDSVTVTCDEHQTVGIYRDYADQPPMTLVAVADGNTLRLAIIDDAANVMLGVGVGATLTVEW